MKNAPNLKYQPEDLFTEAIIFAGEDAYAHAQHWIESEGRKHGDDVPPVYLGPKQLADLASLRIIDDGRRFARVYLAGGIKPIVINAIAEKLALAGVQYARLYKGIPDRQPENWHDYLNRVRQRSESGEASIVDIPGAVSADEPRTEQQRRNLSAHVDRRLDGVYFVTQRQNRETGEITEHAQWLSTPIDVVGIGEDDAERFLILRWEREGLKEARTEAVPLREIGEKEGWMRLKAGGVLVTSKPALRVHLADWLQRTGCRDLWTITTATGWQNGAYIMPDGEVLGKPERPVMFAGRSAAARGYVVRGTADTWRDSVARLAGGNPSMMLGIACSLAAPLIGLVGADGFGVHLFGGSSAGKTTTANAASSVWGSPDDLKLTWYSTALGLVNEAAAHNDGFMPLDEIGQGGNRKAVAESAYALFNGVGKIQGAKDGGNRDLKRWRAMAFSTGEIDLESFIRADGGKINAGQLVRLLNIPISRSTVFHDHADGKAHADAMRDAYQQNHGAVGRAWVQWLAENRRKAVEAVRDAERRQISVLPENASEQVRRVASRFAILEAALMLSRQFTGWSERECIDALTHGFNAWVGEFGIGNRETKSCIEQATAFLQRFGFSRYLPYPNPDPRDLPIRDLAGYRVEMDNGKMFFHTWPVVFRDEIAAGVNPAQFAAVLAAAGMLDKPEKGLSKKTLTHNGKQERFVVLVLAPDDAE